MIPTIEQIEVEFLKLLDSDPKPTKRVIYELRILLNLSEEDSICLTKCGRQKKFDNRVTYVRTKLLREKKINMDESKRVWI